MSPTKKEERDAKDSSTSSLEEEIAQTRSSMSQTIGELHGKLNPGVFKDQVLDQFHEAKESIKADLMEAKNAIKADLKTELAEVKTGLRNELREAKQEFRDATIGRVETMVQNAQEKVTDTSRSLLKVLSDNPIPTAVVGFGLGWLFINARARSRANSASSRTYSNGRARSDGRVEDYAQRAAGSLQQGAKQTVKNLSSQAENLVHQADDATKGVRSEANRLVHDAQDAVGSYVSQAGSSALTLARDARRQAGDVESRVEHMLRENPLPVGAVALALGLAVGLAIPSTKIEDNLMGDTRDTFLEGAEAFVQKQIGALETAAANAVGPSASTAAMTP